MARRSRFAALGLVAVLAALPTARPARGDDPEFNGRKMSAWMALLQDDPAPRKRRAAVVALTQIIATGTLPEENQDTIYQLFGKILRNDPNEGVRAQAANVLGQVRVDSGYAPKAAENISEALRIEKDPAVRRELVAGVVRFAKYLKDNPVKPLTTMLADPDAGLRALAADALGRLAGVAKDAAPDLLPLLKDADKSVQLAAVFALGRVEPTDTAPAAAALIGVFKTSADMDLRREAIVALGLLGDRGADTLKTLTTVLGDPKEDVEFRRHAVLALIRAGTAARSTADDLKKAMKGDADKLVRLNAVRALCAAYGAEKKDLLPELVERLKPDTEPDFEVRISIAEELGGLGMDGKPAVPALRAAQRDPQIKVRDAATAAIKAIEKPPAKPKD